MRRLLIALATLFSVALSLFPTAAAAAYAPGTYTGTLADGAIYKIEVPIGWNGTLVLYSHGYSTSPTGATDIGDAATGAWLLSHGYALAGSSYATTGWALQQAFPDQMAVLDVFQPTVGEAPTRTIAWGHSLGGMITAGLVQLHPDRFDGAIPMCGVVAGGVGAWNQGLDAAFAFKTLLGVAPTALNTSPLQLVHITSPFGNLGASLNVLNQAQATPQGRARIALAAAFGDVPGWFSFSSAEPDPTDYAAREQNQYLWDANVDFFFLFAARAELEARAGGNVSWNTGVNYKVQLAHSINQDEVVALYAAAGLDLDQDLQTLQNATRIAADAGAVAYLESNIVYNGALGLPVLTMHTTGDGLVTPNNEQAYASTVRSAGDNSLLREVFVHRAGHCTFTPAETIAAFQTLVHRLDTGHWRDSTDPELMNAAATALGALNYAPPSFIEYQPPRFLRPFDAGDI